MLALVFGKIIYDWWYKTIVHEDARQKRFQTMRIDKKSM
jgi:hypothetical protein